MFRMVGISFFLLVWIVGCGPRYVDYFPYHDDGTPKPRVVILPIVDSSEAGLSWSPSEGLMRILHEELMDSGRCFVLSEEEMGPARTTIMNTDFLNSDLPGISCSFADFVVALELIEHDLLPCENKILPCPPSTMCNCMFMTKIRIKIVDTRRAIPHVILHEIISKTYRVPKEYSRWFHENVCSDDAKNFQTLFYNAHYPIMCDVAQRIDSEVMSAY